MKVLLINRCARRMRSGAGLLGSLRSIHSQTRSRARFASSRELIVPARPRRRGADAVGGVFAGAGVAGGPAAGVGDALQHFLEQREIGRLVRLEVTLER